MSEDPIKIPKPSDILGNNKIPSPSDILGDTEKKKSTSIIASQKSDSVMNVGSLGGVKFPKYDINEYNTKKPLVKKEVNNIVRDKVSTTPVSRLEVSKEQLNRNNEVTEKKVKELTLASKPYTQISPEKEQEANQDYDNALNKTGVWNKVKQFGTDVLNTSMNVLNKAGMVDEVGDLKLEDPLKKAKEQTLKEVKEQDLSLTNSQFQEKVKDNFTQNRKNEIIHSQLNQFNSDLSPEDRNLLQVDRYNHLTNLDGSQKELLSNTQILKHNRLDTFNEHNALISDINKFVIEGQEPPQELLDKKVSLESNLKDYDTQINKNYQKFSNNKKDIGTFEQELAVYKTEGNDFLNFLGHVKNATLKLGAEGIDFGAYVANVSSNLPSNIPAKILSDYLHDKANKLNESIEEDNATLKQTNTVESPLDFAHKTLNVVADNIPIIAGLTLTGGAGLAGMGATTAGAKFGEMKNEVDKGEANYSNMKMALIPLAWGGTVLAPMATQLKTIQNGARVLESIAKESPELIQKTIKEKAIQYLSDAKTFGKESFKLGNELKVMGILQEGINHFGLGKDVNYDNLLDLGVYADAPVMHGMGKVAPHLLGMSVKPFMNSTDVKNMDSNSAKIFELTKKLNDESTPKEEKDIIQKSINSIAENSKTIIEGKIKSISETPDLVHKEIIAKTLESSNIRSEALRIKTSDNLTDSEKTIALNELKIKYKQNESDRVDFISGNKTVLDILPQKEVLKLKNEASRELMQEQNPDGTKYVKLENVEITKRALENYKKELETKKIEDAKTESPNTETKPQPQAEVQEPTKAEKVDVEKTKYRIAELNNELEQNRISLEKGEMTNRSSKDIKNEIVDLESKLPKEQEKVDESVQNGDIVTDENIRVGDNADLQQSKVENMQSSSNIGEGKTPIEYAREQINNGILEWNGDINSPRIDLEMSWADIRKGQADLAKGKENTVPAKRLIEAINNAKELGGYNYKYGTGGENMRAKEFVSFEDLQKTKNEYNLTDAELKEVKDNELENAKKYDEYFNKLSKEEQIDILDDYENRGNTNTGEVSKNVNGGEIKENISNEQTTSGEGAKREEVSSDSRREKSSEEKAKDLGIDHDKYLDFKDLVEKTPSSGVFKDYLSGKTIEETFGKATNDQSYEATVLLDASQHGDLVLQHAKELFGENYIPKTLEFLKDAKMDNFEKAVVYASMENLMDTMVKESPENKSLKSLQELVYKDSQDNLSNSSKGLNAGRLRRIHNAIKNGYDVEKMTDQILSDKQKEAKTVLQGIDISGEALNKEFDSKEVIDKKFTQEELDFEIKKELEKAKKEWDDANLGFEIRDAKVKIKKEEALAQIQKIKENWKKASKDGTLSASLPYAKQLMAITPDIVKLANIYRQIGGLKTIDIIESIKQDISDVFESISEKDIKDVLKKEFGSKSKKMSEATKRKIYIKLLNKTIESLDNQIEAKKRNVVIKEDKYKNDDEIKELRDTRKLKQEELSEIDPSYSESRKLATDLKLAQKSLDEYQRRIDEGDLSTKEKEPKAIDDNLKKLRDARDLKRKEFLFEKKKYDDSLKEPIIPITKEELADKKYLSDVNNKINSLNKRIEDLKTNKSKSNEGKSTIWNEEISKLENELKDLRNSKKTIKEKAVNVNKKQKQISDVVKQALIDSGFSREIKIKGETKKVLDWVKLTGRMNNVDALRENVETKLKEQGYDDKKIADISNELELEYKRIVNDVIDKSVADLERRDLIKPSPNRKSENRKLADLYNQGLFGDNIKKYENVVNSILGFSDIDNKKYADIKAKAKAMSDLYNQKVEGKPLTDLSISSLASNINKEISDLLTLASLKESGKDGIAGNVYKSTEIFKQFSSLGMKSLLGTIRGLAENKFSGVYAGMLQKLVTRGEMTPELAKQLKKNADVVLKDITQQGGTDYGNTQTTLVSGSLLEDMASNKIKSKIGHQILTAITIRRFLNGYDSYAKVKLTETLFVKNSIKILEKKGWSKKDALNHISEALTGDNFIKALETAENIIDNVNSQQDTKQLKDNSETVHRFAMDIVKQNLMNGDVMTMEEIQKSFNASYKGAGSDIGHEANNYLAVQVGHYSQKLSTELNEAIKDKNWKLASLKNIEIMVNKIIISPFAGGGSNWVVIGAEKGVPIIGYIPTIANALKRTELDLESVSGQKNIEKSLYYDYKTKSSFVRNIASTGMALTAYTTMFGMSGFGLKDDDEENNAKKLNDWMNNNDWVKPYFNKLSPFAFVMATAINDGNYGKLLAQTFGMSGEVFNNSLKVIKSLDNDKEGSTSGAIGKLLGQFSNSPIAWKYILDAFNIWRGLKGLSQIKTDYQLEGFLDGFYQGGFTEATGLVIDNLKGIEQSKKSSSSSSGVKVSKKKFKKYKKF